MENTQTNADTQTPSRRRTSKETVSVSPAQTGYSTSKASLRQITSNFDSIKKYFQNELNLKKIQQKKRTLSSSNSVAGKF